MSQFLGTHQNRLDAKGRVSVPSAFRTTLRAGMGEAVTDENAPVKFILRPSHKHACIEGWPVAKFDTLAASVGQFNTFSDAHEDMSAALYADAFPVETDKEGRVILPAELVAHAGLTNAVAFMGMGETFQIWEPEAATRRRAEAREAARLRQLSLPGSSPVPVAA
jgi:MraZ protein